MEIIPLLQGIATLVEMTMPFVSVNKMKFGMQLDVNMHVRGSARAGHGDHNFASEFQDCQIDHVLSTSTFLFFSSSGSFMASKLLVDIHTHVYLPRYASLLRSRTSVPFIRSATRDGKLDERLLILDHEPSGGRPVRPQYWDREEKLKFMDRHGIDVSVVRWAST